MLTRPSGVVIGGNGQQTASGGPARVGGRVSIFGKPMPNVEVAQTLFEQAPVAMLLIDGVGHIHHLNAAAERLFG